MFCDRGLQQSPLATVYALDKITVEWASLLDGECLAYLRQKNAVHQDCSHVDFIDVRDVEVLNHFAQSQDTRMSAHGFVRELLQIGGR